MNELYNFVKKIGSLRNMQNAIRLVENKGFKVLAWNGLELEVISADSKESGLIEFKEVDGRVWVK